MASGWFALCVVDVAARPGPTTRGTFTVHYSKLAKLCGVAVSLTMFVAACSSSSTKTATSSAPTTTAAATATTAGATATTAGATPTSAGTTATTAGSASGDLDATYGKGAQAFKNAIDATKSKPLVAAGDPFIISMPNLEGDAGGSFPDFREGAQAAVKLINERLGGIGADYKAGKPGRPIKLNVCSHGLTPDAAQACANTVAGEKPNLVTIGIDFFTQAMYPVFQQFPIIQMLPIFVADFTQAGAFSAIGGCPTAFFGAANFLATKGYDKVAVMYSDNGPGHECQTDTTERPLQYLKDQGKIADFKGYANKPGDPSDDAAQYQEITTFLAGAKKPAVFYSVASSDCVDWTKGLRAAGYTADLVMGSACVDKTVEALPEAVGAAFEFQSYNPDSPTLTDFEKFELGARSDAIKAFGPKSAVGTFMEDSFGSILWSWQIANNMVADGKDPFDRAALISALKALPPFHFIGRPAVDCSGNPSEFPAICFRKNTYLTWDGKAFGPEDALKGKYQDLTDLMNQVAAKNQRKK